MIINIVLLVFGLLFLFSTVKYMHSYYQTKDLVMAQEKEINTKQRMYRYNLIALITIMVLLFWRTL